MPERSYPEWLDSALLYEVYPQSFLDANGDGVGDLPGVTRKLDYIRDLGCNTVWLNPIYQSPFGDAGYDVSDYRRVAPRYGSNADLKTLCREAHRRGMRLVLDFVPGHTSVEHPWFRKSCEPRPNRYSNRYIWTDSVWRGAPGFNIVNGYGARDGNYVPNFFHFQPALNYGFARPDPKQPWQLSTRHPDVLALRREMRGIMRFWLDMGVDGFRVDMASSLVKNDADGAAMRRFWHEERQWLDRDYPEAVLISEWSRPDHAIPAGFHVDFLIHFNLPAYTYLFRKEPERFGFDPGSLFPGGFDTSFPGSYFDGAGRGDIAGFLSVFRECLAKTRGRGLISVPTGNHDISRLRCGRGERDLEVIFAFLLTLPGVPAIYYGDEIGLRHQPSLVSREGGYHRTGARTPMQWDGSRNAGFSTAAPSRLYLPVDPKRDRPTVAAQERDPASLLNTVRRLAALRREHPALGNTGDIEPIHAAPGRYPFAYLRRDRAGRGPVLVVLNPSGRRKTAAFRLPAGLGKAEPALLLANGVRVSVRAGVCRAVCDPRSYAVAGLLPGRAR